MTNYGREPVAGGISQYNNDLYLYVPNYSENIEASGCIQRGIHTPLSNLGNATASKVLTGNTFTSSAGLKITGTIASKAAATYTPGTTNQTIASGQYLSGAQTIKGDANLVAANIKKGTSIFGITGNYNGAVNVYSNFCSIEAGTWSGATLKDTAYVNLASSSITSEWIYNHNLSLDLEKIKFIVGSFIYPSDVDYALRFSRGYASSSTTAQYWYRTQMTAFGSADIGFTTEEYGSNVHVYGEGFIYEGALYKDYKLGASINGDAVKILSGIAAYYYIDTKNIGNNAGIMEVYVTENQISFKFIHNGANPVAIRGLKPRFAFMIGYTD